MSTSLLGHALEMGGYHDGRTEYVGREIVFTVVQQAAILKFPVVVPRT
jgi:hypothetical protein